MAPALALAPRMAAAASASTITRRALSTTTTFLYRQPRVPDSDLPIPSVTGQPPAGMPPYPYGPRQVYHQSNTGLYGSARIRFGNKVSERNEIKTRRKWRPNVHHKRIWSQSLGVFVRTRVTTRVLRTIDKVGGLDAYLLGDKPARVRELGPWGWRLRWRIMQTPAVRDMFAKQRAALGLPEQTEAEQIQQQAQEMGSMLGITTEEAAQQLTDDETNKMLDGEEEFTLGDVEGQEEGQGNEEGGVMREEAGPPKRA
ncbi:ribosomal L28 family-domain-containing protein [Diplogelasinospora grovesii]|uniref:Large ribosomal subunit protein bL28m n=1 Tax=Diplogelasinospora grovesii TaxID=303347 RepID=A0AAN6S391_9PEZI|nr:ribosomal L28 family-domain-containing protein [Diplogelasinospora grovesii]